MSRHEQNGSKKPAVSTPERGELGKLLQSYQAHEANEPGDVPGYNIYPKETPMLTEDDLNRIKGLLHFLNGATRASERRLQVADPQERERGAQSDLSFDVNAIDSNGEVLGMIKTDGTAYCFYPGLKA